MGVQFLFGALLVVLTVIAVETALGLCFDPRYRDFPFAALTGALVPFLVATTPRLSFRRWRASAETVAATMLAIAAIYIFLNETAQNWQASWYCAALIALAFILAQVRGEPG